MNHITAGRGPRALPRLLLASAFALSLAGCDTDEIVRVENPEELEPLATENAAAVPALVNGAFRQFAGGYSGFGLDDSFLSMSGVISDEFAWGDSFTTRFAADRRTLQTPNLGNISDPAFLRLHQSRQQVRRALVLVDRFEAELEDPDADRTILHTTEGYVYVTLSEGWCGAVPFSVVPDEGPIDPNTIEFGTPETTVQMNERAVASFDAALAVDPNSSLTKIGKARALLNLGRYAEAEAAVAGVGNTFVFHIEHSTNTSAQNNPLTALIDNGRYSIANLEGGLTATGTALRPDNNTATSAPSAEGLPFREARDPRLPWVARPASNPGRCFTSSIFCWTLNNYPTLTADVPLASGVEARLVEAEAALQRGDPVTMMAKLNELRANAAGLLPLLYPEQRQVFPAPTAGAVSLAPLTDPGIGVILPADQFTARRNLLFRERAFWLFGTGHRQGDLRRLVRNYGLLPDAVFASGPYFRGGNYGTDVAYPVPFNEENNPDFDPATCVTSQA